MKKTVLLLLALLTLGCASGRSSPSAGIHAVQLKAIADELWAREIENNIQVRLQNGLRVEKMPDVSYARAEQDAAFARTVLDRLNRIHSTKLGEQDWLTYQTLRWRQQSVVDGLPHFWHSFSITPYASPIRITNQVLTEYKFATTEDGQRYVALLLDYTRLIDGLRDVAREQQRRGILIPRPELPAVRGMLDGLRHDADQSLFLPAASRLTALSSEQREVFSASVRRAITQTVNPSLQRLSDFFSSDYQQAAPAGVGVSQYPSGADAYRFLMRERTSLDLSPEEVHRLGLAEVERLQLQLDDIRRQVGFSGTSADFHHFLKTDPRFFGKSADDMRERLERYVRMIEPHLDQFFLRKPLAGYGVKRLDPSLEGSMTFGYYKPATVSDRVGIYYFNGSKPNERSLLFAASLMAHELVPGHHFQIARQDENQALHPLRRASRDTVFTEGWGEYASELAGEMGLYADPYDRAGRVMADMLLSSRLVVDTGMNALGWSREKAMVFLRQHSMLSETEIATETLRYSTDIPAQALAYKIGSLKILALRERARKELGMRFDIRQFHEWVIGSGSMPMTVLEAWVERKIAEARQ